MKTLFCCFCFILTNTVIAQAGSIQAELGIARIESYKWISTHSGQTQLDGMAVAASLESQTKDLSIPSLLAGTATASVQPAKSKKEYRLVLTSLENPRLKAHYVLNSGVVSVDGQIRQGFTSANGEEFEFLLVPQEDGALDVSYTRKMGEGKTEQGKFTLEPLLLAQ